MTPTTSRPRALLLEADRRTLRRLRRALERRGFDVATARDGERGLSLLLDGLLGLDVLVVARDLPGRDAAALTRLIRHAGGERDLAIVVVSPEGGGASTAQLLALGADAVTAEAGVPAAAARVCGRPAPAPTPVPWSLSLVAACA